MLLRCGIWPAVKLPGQSVAHAEAPELQLTLSLRLKVVSKREPRGHSFLVLSCRPGAEADGHQFLQPGAELGGPGLPLSHLLFELPHLLLRPPHLTKVHLSDQGDGLAREFLYGVRSWPRSRTAGGTLRKHP